MSRWTSTAPLDISRRARRIIGLVGGLLGGAVVVWVLVWFAWTKAETREQLNLVEQHAMRVAELRGKFAYLDELLTMSAHMAVMSGDPHWKSRYDETTPELVAAIAEAMALATPEVRAALASTTEEARGGLAQMEQAALAMAGRGDRGDAELLLNGPEFAYLKSSYASGTEALGQELVTLAASRSKALSERAWAQTAGFAAVALVLVGALIAAVGHLKLRVALARTTKVARTDDLTDLPNRRYLNEMLADMLARAETEGGAVVLLLLDLDRFKAVNDVHGHPAGDHLLQLVAGRLRAIARTDDVVARLGGDEFALAAWLPPPWHPCPPAEQAAQIARRIIAQLEEPFGLCNGTSAQVGVSIGLAMPDGGADEVNALMRRADVALYRAKTAGRGRYSFFEPVMEADIQARALLELELRCAITDGQIIPYFQPLVGLERGRLIGFEMLARWRHPTRGMVSPAEFIPVAEQVGLIGPLTSSLLTRACQLATEWPADTFVACNVSPLQLRDHGLPAMVRAALDLAGLPAHRLELEITESALVGDLNLARDVLSELKAEGVRLALDDFGTGYSSLHHLQMLPFEKLKIDASFVSSMTRDPGSRKIVSAVIGLGQSLQLTVVAEGVEDQETADMLRDFGCDVGQGWLFGRPGPAEMANKLLSFDRSDSLQNPSQV